MVAVDVCGNHFLLGIAELPSDPPGESASVPPAATISFTIMLGTLVSTLGLRVGRPLTMSAALSPAGGPLCPPLPSEVPTAARGLATFAMG